MRMMHALATLTLGLGLASWFSLEARSDAAEATQLATITVTTPDAVNILPLAAGQPRLYDANPPRTIEKVRVDLAEAEFTSIPQKIVNQYQIHVETPGVIYAFGGKLSKPRILEETLLGMKDARWIRDLAISGQALGTCYRRTVSAGENLSLHGFELQVAARTIAMAVPGGVVQNKIKLPSKQIEPLLEPSLNAILEPLQENPPMPRVAVEKVRAFLGAGVVTSKTASLKKVYECAMAVCEALTNAMDQRAESRAAVAASGLMPSLSNGGSIIISSGRGSGPGAGGAGEAIRKKQKDERSYADRKAKGLSNFIDSAAYKEWVTRTAGLRTNVMDLYTQLVQLEATEPAFNPVPANVAANPAAPNGLVPNVVVPNAVAPNAVVPNVTPVNPVPEPGKPVAAPPVEDARTDVFVNSLGMKFVPAGTPGVLFCIWDTRVKDFAQFTTETGYDMNRGEKPFTLEGDGKGGTVWKRAGGSWRNPHFQNGATQTEINPVVCVNWHDAKVFCEWLTKKERVSGLITPAQEYRLPLDHEWSVAVGIGDREDANEPPAKKSDAIVDVYPWGTQWPPPPGTGNFAGEESKVPAAGGQQGKIDGYNDSFPYTSPVGSFPANSYGLYDMAGNVWQWCEDRFGPKSAENVVRGGAWSSSNEIHLRSSHRMHVPFNDRNVSRGFRIVLSGSVVNPVVANAAVGNVASGDTAAAPNAALVPASDTVASLAAQGRKTNEFVNSLGMKFVNAGTPGVRFCIWDTRVKDFAHFVDEAGYDMNPGEKPFTWEKDGKAGWAWKQVGGNWRNPHFPAQTDDDPVVCVNWNNAKAFCEWLTKKERASGAISPAQEYRLPMDHEWSTAAGIGDREDANASPEKKSAAIVGVYPWGTQWPPPAGSGNFAGEESRVGPGAADRWKERTLDGYNDGFPVTSPVGSFAPNAYGLFDMAGNVEQWCEDRFSGKNPERVKRGGAWTMCEELKLRSSHRNHSAAGSRYVGCGFRVVLVESGG